MILDPGVLAVLAAATLVLALLTGAAGAAVPILRHWDLSSGSARQLRLERQTYLVSTLIAVALLIQVFSFFLLLTVIDRSASGLIGAMCGIGVLRANPYGPPALGGSVLLFFAAALWLIINHADTFGRDYPLLRCKYRWLLALYPLATATAVLQVLFFINLRRDVITSCCGSLFSRSRNGVPVDLAALPVLPALFGLALLTGLLLLLGRRVRQTGRFGELYALGCALWFAAAAATLIGAVSPFIYELPTHHCPFCFLHREYNAIGYPLYALLLFGTAAGVGGGLLSHWRRVPTLAVDLPAFQRRLIATADAMILVFLLLLIVLIWRSNLTLAGAVI